MMNETVGTRERTGLEGVITFPEGIPGFPDARTFALVEVAPGSAFQCLQSVDEAGLSLIVAVPWLFFPDYAPEMSDLEREELGIEAPTDAIVFCPCTLDPANSKVTMNLMGPFVVNARTNIGRQLVLAGSDQPLRAPLVLS